jgi:hypothetical protein
VHCQVLVDTVVGVAQLLLADSCAACSVLTDCTHQGYGAEAAVR